MPNLCRQAAFLLLFLALGSCGGGGGGADSNGGGPKSTAVTISGRVTGLASGQQITLQDNGADTLVLTANGSFAFPTQVALGANYSVTVTSQPSQQFCGVDFGAGTVPPSDTVAEVQVICANLQVLYSFKGGSDGAAPQAGLIMDAAGNLYGTTSDSQGVAVGDAPPDAGTVFELSPAPGGGYTESVLYDFASTEALNGTNPAGALIMDGAGNLYGTTAGGGSNGFGTVFKLARSGGGYTESVLFSFPGGGGGGYPGSGVIMDGTGNLYGATGSATGVVFKLSPAAGGGYTESVLHSFTDDTNDGGYPDNLVIDGAGNLYGIASSGGMYLDGIVFKLSPNTNGTYTESILYTFPSNNGEPGPWDDLIMDSSGNLFGTKMGANLVFELSPDGSGGFTESPLDDVPGVVGPPLKDSAGNLYVMGVGGDVNGNTSYGKVVELSPNGSGGYTESVLYSFTGGADGAGPNGGLIIDNAGDLYGTTGSGGNADNCDLDQNLPPGCGTVYEFRLH